MVTWYNKETRNETNKFYGVRSVERSDDWDNPKNNFTKIAPASQCLTNDVACDWNETTKAWDIDTASNQAHIDSQAAIQAFVDSAFNDLTLTEANTYIDANWSTLVSSKATFKLLVEFVIGLREVLRGVVTTK